LATGASRLALRLPASSCADWLAASARDLCSDTVGNADLRPPAGAVPGYGNEYDRVSPARVRGAAPVRLDNLAFLGQTRSATSFGIFTGTWLAFGFTTLNTRPDQPSPVLGVFLLSTAGIFEMLMGGGLVGGKAAAGIVILAGAARFLLSGLYQLASTTGIEHAAGIVGLVFVGVACYVGLATLLEGNARHPILPIGRRDLARSAFGEDLAAQLEEIEHEAGVGEQL
jgi:hypothetical protein